MPSPYPTARTCPLDPETGKFQSEVVEFAYSKEAVKLGITREQFQLIMQAHNFAEDRSKMEYQKFREQREKEVLEQMAKEAIGKPYPPRIGKIAHAEVIEGRVMCSVILDIPPEGTSLAITVPL